MMTLENIERFGCVSCGYFSNSVSNVKRHNLSRKHFANIDNNSLSNVVLYQCTICKKVYKSQPGL